MSVAILISFFLNALLFLEQLQRLVTTGALPCSKEEAASLAAIQLRLQECLPSIKLASSKYSSQQSCNPQTQHNQVGISFFFVLTFFLYIPPPLPPAPLLSTFSSSTCQNAGKCDQTGRYGGRSSRWIQWPAASSTPEREQGGRRCCCGNNCPFL